MVQQPIKQIIFIFSVKLGPQRPFTQLQDRLQNAYPSFILRVVLLTSSELVIVMKIVKPIDPIQKKEGHVKYSRQFMFQDLLCHSKASNTDEYQDPFNNLPPDSKIRAL